MTVSILRQLYLRQGGRCFYCDRPMRMDGPNADDLATRDHVLPRRLRRLDAHASDNGISVAACYLCNTERGQLPAHEYVAVWGMRLEQQT